MSDFDKDTLAALDSIDKVNPFATYLEDSTLSRVGGWIDTGSYVLNAIISGFYSWRYSTRTCNDAWW